MSAIGFHLATRADDTDLRRLLRENPVGGGYVLGLEREPDAFAADFGLSERHAFIVARRQDSGEAVGMCERLVAPAFVNGRIERLPYLGALRVSGSHRHRIAILKGGFDALRRFVERADELPFALTSIAADNAGARRVLTAGLQGMPNYTPLAAYSTFLLRPRRCRIAPAIAVAGEGDLPPLAQFLQDQLARHPCAPVWTEQRLRLCLPSASFLIWREGGRILGSVGVWDQRAHRQAVVRAYPARIAAWRGMINLVAPVVGLPRFPPVGTALAQAFLSHLAIAGDNPQIARALIGAGLDRAHRQGLSVAVAGCATDHPRRALIRKHWRGVEYATNLYRVHREALPPMAGLPMPEVALL